MSYFNADIKAREFISGTNSNLNFTTSGGRITIINDGGLDGSNAIVIASNSGSSETIGIHNTRGTGGEAVKLVSHKGGLLFDAIAGSAGTGNVVIKSSGLYPLDIGQSGSGDWTLLNKTSGKNIKFVTTTSGGSYTEVVDIDNTGNVNIKNGSGGVSGSGNSITFKDSLSNIGSVTSGVMDIRSNFINLEASSNVVIKSNGTQSLHFGYQDLRNDGVSGGEWKIVNTDANSNIHLVTTDSNGAQNNVMVADSYGRVGIGTTPNSSDYALDVYGGFKGTSNSGANEFRVLDEHIKMEFTGSNCVFKKNNTSDTKIFNNGGGYLSLGASGVNDHMVIKNNGRVGIGTDNPESQLHVKGSGAYVTVERDSNSSSQQVGIKIDGGTGGQVWQMYQQNNNDDLRFWMTTAGDILNLTSTGRVGIGTTNPGAILTMGNGKFRFYSDNVAANFYEMFAAGDAQLYFYDSKYNRIPGYLNGTNGSWVDNVSFTGQHRCLINNNIDIINKGLIISADNTLINLNNSNYPSINESLPYCKITNIDNDINVFGVISDEEDTNDNREFSAGAFTSVIKKKNKNEKRLFINSLGEGAIWVCNKNGVLVNGDYITSCTVPGYGVKQTLESGTLKNYTVAKATIKCDFNLTKIAKQKLKVITTTITKEKDVYQDIEKTREKTEIVYDEELGRYVQKTTTETYTDHEQVFDTVDLYNEAGEIIGTHQAPRKESYTETETEIDYDANGDVQFEDDLDENGQQQMVYPLDTRFLLADGTVLADETEYNTRLGNGEEVYIACFVGCTYHCG